jgi:hypothetical protein
MDEVTLSGELPAGPFAFAPARPGPGDGLDTTVYHFDGVTARGVEFPLDEVRIHVRGSEFEDCVFRQDMRLTKANRKRYAYSYGMGLLGQDRRPVYRNCVFDHVDFGRRGGGYVPGAARFEGCTFHQCWFRDFTAWEADVVDCTFVGTITSARFSRHVTPHDRESRRNAFAGNDFSQARLRRVEFWGIDLRDSRLPDGPEYLRVDDFLNRALDVRAAMADWPADQREDGDFLLRLYEERASEPFFHWRDGLAGKDSAVWSLLESLTV